MEEVKVFKGTIKAYMQRIYYAFVHKEDGEVF